MNIFSLQCTGFTNETSCKDNHCFWNRLNGTCSAGCERLPNLWKFGTDEELLIVHTSTPQEFESQFGMEMYPHHENENLAAFCNL